MRFVGGRTQAEFTDRVRGQDPARCLVVPVDVGKSAAAALVADLYGEVVVAAFRFDLNEPGVAEFLDHVDRVCERRGAVMCRVGVEAAGHYHRTLVARLVGEDLEVVELNPAHVKEMRGRQGRRRLKTDELDLAAAAELLIRGGGTTPRAVDALAVLEVWVVHRRRKVAASVALSNQIQGMVDQLFPGLSGCYANLMGERSARIIIAEICDPVRIRRLGAKRLHRFVANRGVSMWRSKTAQVVQAARDSLRLPSRQRDALQETITGDMALYEQLQREIAQADRRLAEVLPDTPAGVLTSLPGVSVVRASNYGAAIGDPHRFTDAGAAYRMAGLVPAEHQSSDTARGGQPISREGRRDARQAILELGRGLTTHEPDFADYRQRLLDANKPKKVAAIAAGRRAHRLAFAMMRDQTLYDPDAWRAGVAAGRSVMAENTACQRDVAAPPPTTSLHPDGKEHNHEPALAGV